MGYKCHRSASWNLVNYNYLQEFQKPAGGALATSGPLHTSIQSFWYIMEKHGQGVLNGEGNHLGGIWQLLQDFLPNISALDLFQIALLPILAIFFIASLKEFVFSSCSVGYVISCNLKFHFSPKSFSKPCSYEIKIFQHEPKM